MNKVLERFREFARQFGAEFYVASGLEKTSQQQLALLWSGSEKQFAYFANRIFEPDTIKTLRVGRRPLAMSDTISEYFNCSLSIVLVPKCYVPLIRPSSDICLPLWVDCQVDLCDTQTFAACDSIGADLRRIRKHKLSWTRAQDESELRHFYERIYWPTIRSSHGTAALPASRDKRLSQFAKGYIDLIKVIFNGEVIAGVTIDYRDDMPALRDVGVLDGARAIKKMGAVTAANVFAMAYLAERGYSQVNFGLSRSFLDDGVLNFKRKFMPTIVSGSRDCVLLGVKKLDDAVRSLLRASACISWQDGKLSRTYFLDSSIKPCNERARRHRSEWLFGVANECVFDISGRRVQRLKATTDSAPA